MSSPKSDVFTLDTFCKNMHTNVDVFKEFYLRERAKNPKNWPSRMGDGDWYEQFLIFMADPDEDGKV
jgi:hypothetical protein